MVADEIDPHDVSSNAGKLFKQKVTTFRRQRISVETPVVSIVGQIAAQKRQDLLIRAIAVLQKGNRPVKALIVGDIGPGQDWYARQLHKLVHDPNVESCIYFWGFEPHVEMVYAISTLLAMCMPDEGGGGGVGIEAMAMGVPVLAPDAGSTHELVDDGVNGFLYKADSPEDLAHVIARVLNNPDLLRTVSDNARASPQKFSIEAQVANMQNIYDSVLVRKNPDSLRYVPRHSLRIAPSSKA